MIGGLIAGGLGAALAAVAELLIWSAPVRDEEPARGMRARAATFVGGEVLLGLVLIALTLTEVGTIDPAIGLLSGTLMGLGSFGIALTYRGFAGAPGEITPRDRAGTIVRMASAQGVGVIGVVIAILSMFLSPS